MQQTETENVTDRLIDFLRKYYADEIAEFAQHYPNERTSLYVEFKDIATWSDEIAADVKKKPGKMSEHLSEALRLYDLPVDMKINNADVRITDTHGWLERVKLGDLTSDDISDGLHALQCQIGKVTSVKPKLTESAFQCQRCGTMTYITQSDTGFQEPHECVGCERQGPFKLDLDESDFVDHRKLKLEEPPEEQVNGAGDELIARCDGDIVHIGGENGLQDRAGARATILGELYADTSAMFGNSTDEPIADWYFVPSAFVFGDESEKDDIEAEEFREEVEEFAKRDDAIDLFARSIDPGLTMTPKWELATEMATAYLFAAPRINPDDGDMIRGDIHMLFVSDPGMRKSVFGECVAKLSPQGDVREATGMSSDVGLTASANRDDFGDGQWTLSPGALPRANGGHLILDEIDKGPGLGGIHGCLEGNQVFKADKAGMQATLPTRLGFMALGNPVSGRFDKYEPIAEQIGLDPALMSRFDLIVTMQDTPDSEMDEAIGKGILDTIDESARIQYAGLDAEEADAVRPDVTQDVMKAWVALGREIEPMLTEAAKDVLRSFYVDTRQLNGEESEKPPATARTLVSGVRTAMAFARCTLSESVEERHAKRAVDCSKAVVGENFDSETGEFDADRTTEAKTSQQTRKEKVKEALSENEQTTAEIAAEAGVEENMVGEELKVLHENGDVLMPSQGVWRTV